MDAENVERYTKNIPHFGGIFDIEQLQNVKIISYPVTLILHDHGHWLGIFMSKHRVEIMDSLGYLNKSRINKYLLKLLQVHIYNKKFFISPTLQSKQSSSCALYAISFLYYRTNTHQSICQFCKIFTNDRNLNCVIIYRIFNIFTSK